MERRSFEVVVRSDAPPDVVFAVLADGSRWHEWAGPLVPRSSWEREGDPPPGGVGAVRRLGLWPFVGREEVVEHVPPVRHSYVVLSGIPVDDYRADVELTPDGAGTTIAWRGAFSPRLPRTGRLLERVLRAIVGGLARRLAAEAARIRLERPAI